MYEPVGTGVTQGDFVQLLIKKVHQQSRHSSGEHVLFYKKRSNFNNKTQNNPTKDVKVNVEIADALVIVVCHSEESVEESS